MKKIPLAKPYFTEEEVNEVRSTLESGWVAQGPRVKKFEETIAQYTHTPHCVAVNSCTSALHLSLLAHGISEGDKVLIPDFTYVATGNVVLHVGATPVIVDIDPTTLCIDVDDLLTKIDDGVKAIIPVHAFGYPAKIQEINKIAKKHDIVVIEDAALALGSESNGQQIGSFGNTACFSLQGRKVVTTGEGGLVVTTDDNIAGKIAALRSQGITPNIEGKTSNLFQMVGLSYRLSDIQAGIGIIQMKKIEEFLKKRITLAKHYNDLFEDTHLNLQTPPISPEIKQNFQTYVIILNEGNRNEIIPQLKKKGIESTIGTYSLSSQPLFKQKKEFPNSTYAFEHSLALPLYHELTEDDVSYIVKCIKLLFK
jgi:dTDP-4-amino-4,6-dideoxygalactose transaminase